jgi:pSer/pThr/pTyr-binding forkhead associated (FHA) protein
MRKQRAVLFLILLALVGLAGGYVVGGLQAYTLDRPGSAASQFFVWFNYGCYGGLACCALAIAADALYTALSKRSPMRRLAWAVVCSVISALFLLPALLWYNLRFSVGLPVVQVGLTLSYVALFGWVFPCIITTVYCIFPFQQATNPAGHVQGQRKRAISARDEATSPKPPRRQPGVIAPFVYSADHPWGWLVYRNGKFLGQELALNCSIASIGREEDNEVWLDDDTISRYHAELAWDKGQVYITDNDSLNGVLLNKQRIRSSTLVKSGDELEIGAHRFLFKSAEQPETVNDLDDPLLPQLRRISASRNGAGVSTSAGASKVGRPLGPTVALNHSQPESETPSELGGSLVGDEEDISWQDTAKFAGSTPIPLSQKLSGLCIVRSGEMAGRSFLLDRPLLTVGRDSESDIVIDDSSISRRHVQFSRQIDGDYIQDLASRNRSQVNGKPLNTLYRLRQGDIITLGDIQMEYTLLPDAQTTPIQLPLSPPPLNLSLSLRLPSKSKE